MVTLTQAELDMHVLFVEVFWPIRVLPRQVKVRGFSETPHQRLTTYSSKGRLAIRGYMLQLLKEIKSEQVMVIVESD